MLFHVLTTCVHFNCQSAMCSLFILLYVNSHMFCSDCIKIFIANDASDSTACVMVCVLCIFIKNKSEYFLLPRISDTLFLTYFYLQHDIAHVAYDTLALKVLALLFASLNSNR